MKLAKKAEKNIQLKEAINKFKSPDMSQHDIIEYGEKFILALYNATKKDNDLNKLRFTLFSK